MSWRWRAGLALAAALTACGDGKPRPVTPDPIGHGDEPTPAPDEPPLEERIAAVEHAMTELAPVAQQCWAAAAAERLAVAGRVHLLITIAADGRATAEPTVDEPAAPILTRCLVSVAAAYRWAPPLFGQAIELPFAFTAPPMQNVIDRRLVPHRAQAGVDVAVLLDELNTANPAFSLLEVAVASGARSGPRQLERIEVWHFLTPATVAWVGATPRPVAAGDALYVPVGARLTVEPAGGLPVRAVVALVPGGREGAARAGALPGPTAGLVGGSPPPAVLIAAGVGKPYARPGGTAKIRVEPGVPARAVGRELSLLGLTLDAGATVPEHVHPAETEVLYLLGGGGTMTVGGVEVAVTADSVIQVPPGVAHAFVASAATTAIQLYTPAGPEQRWKGAR